MLPKLLLLKCIQILFQLNSKTLIIKLLFKFSFTNVKIQIVKFALMMKIKIQELNVQNARMDILCKVVHVSQVCQLKMEKEHRLRFK